MKENGFRILRGVVTVSAPCSLLSSLLITFEEVTVYLVGQAVGWLVGVVCITDNVGFLCTYFKHCASFYYEQRRDRDTEKLDMTPPHCRGPLPHQRD